MVYLLAVGMLRARCGASNPRCSGICASPGAATAGGRAGGCPALLEPPHHTQLGQRRGGRARKKMAAVGDRDRTRPRSWQCRELRWYCGGTSPPWYPRQPGQQPRSAGLHSGSPQGMLSSFDRKASGNETFKNVRRIFLKAQTLTEGDQRFAPGVTRVISRRNGGLTTWFDTAGIVVPQKDQHGTQGDCAVSVRHRWSTS